MGSSNRSVRKVLTVRQRIIRMKIESSGLPLSPPKNLRIDLQSK